MNTLSGTPELKESPLRKIYGDEALAAMYAMQLALRVMGYPDIPLSESIEQRDGTLLDFNQKYRELFFCNPNEPGIAPNSYYALFFEVYEWLRNNPGLLDQFLEELEPYLLAVSGEIPVFRKNGKWEFVGTSGELLPTGDLVQRVKKLVQIAAQKVRSYGFQKENPKHRREVMEQGIRYWKEQNGLPIDTPLSSVGPRPALYDPLGQLGDMISHRTLRYQYTPFGSPKSEILELIYGMYIDGDKRIFSIFPESEGQGDIIMNQCIMMDARGTSSTLSKDPAESYQRFIRRILGKISPEGGGYTIIRWSAPVDPENQDLQSILSRFYDR